jgi:hypothetical protein
VAVSFIGGGNLKTPFLMFGNKYVFFVALYNLVGKTITKTFKSVGLVESGPHHHLIEN